MKIQLNDHVIVLTSKLYAAALSVVLLPFFLETLGKEQYGLVGTFIVLQACMQVLDAGVSGALTRQSILSQKNHQSFMLFLKQAKRIVKFFVLISVLIFIVGLYFAKNYSGEWFQTTLAGGVIENAVLTMFSIVAIKYIQGPFKSILLSCHKHKLISCLDIAYSTLNGPLILIILMTFSWGIESYFVLQLLVSVLSLLAYAFFTAYESNRRLDDLNDSENGELVSSRFTDIIKFGANLSILSTLWVVVTQSDKLTLTRYMSLSEYSFYSISLSILGLVSIFTATMIQTMRPKFTEYYVNKDVGPMSQLFVNSFRTLVSIIVPIVIFLIYFGSDALYIWTQSEELATEVMKYLPYLLIGSVFSSFSEFSFVILYSVGKLRAHTRFYLLVSFIIIPLNIYVASNYLGEGSSMTFMLYNAILFLTWSMYNITNYMSGAFVFMFKVLSCAVFVSIAICSAIKQLFLFTDFTDFADLMILMLSGVISIAVILGLSHIISGTCDLKFKQD